MPTKSKKCPSCTSTRTVKRGATAGGKQLHWCKECGHRFTNSKQQKNIHIKKIWDQYVFGKQTIRELSKAYELNKKTVVSYLERYVPRTKKHHARPINLVADATYFGERNEGTTWCIIVFRDPEQKENLWWTYTDTETERAYREGRKYLEHIGYTILSVTGDGFGGLRSAFSGIAFQMCLVHMERIVIRGTTRKPKLIQGQVLLALIKTIFDTDEEVFKQRVNQYIETYRNFLNEKATSSLTGESWWVHDDLRKAVFSIVRFLPYLFTFKQNQHIPPTTNSLEGHFRHVKVVTAVHGGMSRTFKEKVLTSIMLASTIAPTDEKLKEIL